MVERHKFKTGQSVVFSPNRHEDRSARGLYTIVHLLPEVQSTPQYRIKAKRDGHERVVRENQLDEARDSFEALVSGASAAAEKPKEPPKAGAIASQRRVRTQTAPQRR
jgi:hypothetical protein